MTGCGDVEALTKEEILDLSADELDAALYIQILMLDLDEEDYEGSIRAMSEEKQKFYILSDFDTEYFAGGLASYLCYTECAFVEDTEELLREFGFTEAADVYGEFFDENDIDFEKYLSSEDDFIESIEADYPIEEFNEEFDKVYDSDAVCEAIADYVKANVDAFV